MDTVDLSIDEARSEDADEIKQRARPVTEN